MTTPSPLAIGAHRDFPAGRVTVSVIRDADKVYRVVVLGRPCFTRTFDAAAGDLPLGTSVRRHTFNYVQLLVAEFTADAETPAAVVARLAA